MTAKPRHRWFAFSLRTLFVLVTLVVMLLIFAGGAFIPTLPYFQLDAILSREELADAAKREETVAMLRNQVEYPAAVCLSAGWVAFAAGTVGVFFTSGRPATHS